MLLYFKILSTSAENHSRRYVGMDEGGYPKIPWA